MRKHTPWLLATILLLLAASCDKPEKTESIDVQFEVPSSMSVEYGASTLSFRIQFGKAPELSDKIILGTPEGDLRSCSITSIEERYFHISIWEGFSSGSYAVYLQRGSTKIQKGTMTVTINYNNPGEKITPDEGTTVYGVVSCGDTPLSGVVVSDGVEAVQTDKDGIYQLKSIKKHGYVFISTPSGYENLREGILPVLHQQLSQGQAIPERVDFQLKEAGDQTAHTMLIMGDIHLANRTGDRKQWAEFVADLNAMTASLGGKKKYGLTLGDMTWDLYWITNSYGFKEYLADANTIKDLAIFHTIGNHDHSMYFTGDFDTVKEYKKLIAPTYYSFNIGKVHYVVLDDIECTNSTPAGTDKGGTYYNRTYNTLINQEQMDWLAKDLSFVPKSTPLVITTHAPLYSDQGRYNLVNSAALESAVKAWSEVHLFTGHTHKMYNIDNLSTDHLFEHNAGAVCATWWWSANQTPGVHVAQDGAPGGYTILTVNGKDFKWQFKGTGNATSYQFRTYDRNQIQLTADKYVPNASSEKKEDFLKYASVWTSASASNEVYINVWNYDPSWSVEVKENGTPLSVTKTSARDPLHLIAYTAKRLDKNSSATFPTSVTYHIFKVKASGPSSTLEIKVTDRFGNVYQETMARPKAFSTDAYKF